MAVWLLAFMPGKREEPLTARRRGFAEIAKERSVG